MKLVNDWIYLPNEALKFMKDRIRENMGTGTNVFFTGNWLRNNPVCFKLRNGSIKEQNENGLYIVLIRLVHMRNLVQNEKYF